MKRWLSTASTVTTEIASTIPGNLSGFSFDTTGSWLAEGLSVYTITTGLHFTTPVPLMYYGSVNSLWSEHAGCLGQCLWKITFCFWTSTLPFSLQNNLQFFSTTARNITFIKPENMFVHPLANKVNRSMCPQLSCWDCGKSSPAPNPPYAVGPPGHLSPGHTTFFPPGSAPFTITRVESNLFTRSLCLFTF